MKLQMEFESSDLRDMVKTYFSKSGFHVKNLNDICDKFNNAYPQGIVVNVEVTNGEVPEIEQETKIEDNLDTKEMPEVEISDTASENVALSAADLLDPTPGISGVPNRDALIKQHQRELETILAKSDDLKGK